MEELVFAELLEQEGVVFKDENHRTQVLKELREAVERGQFHFIVRDGRRIGFFVYREVIHNGVKHYYIDDLLIYKRFRNPSSLLNLRGYFRNMENHKHIKFYFWHSQKHNRFYYGH